MRAVNDAWAVLGDARRRASYDEQLRLRPRPEPAWSNSNPATGAGGGAHGWGRAEPAPAAGPADWRRHASPGPALSRPRWARIMAVVPACLLLLAALLVGASAVLRLPEVGSLAVAVGIVAALAFAAAPILAMKEARRAQRRPRH